MKIDLTCPVELWQYTTPTQEHPECGFVLNNLSDKVVISVQTTLVCYAEDGELLFRQVERVQGLHAGAGERFNFTLLTSQWEGVKTIDLVIEKVWFDDTTIWRRGSAPLKEYRSNALPPGRKLDRLRFVAGADAVGYPQEQENVWVCVCGRANDLHNDRCCRCERKRETVFAACSQANVEQLNAVHDQMMDDTARAALEEASRLTEEREKNKHRLSRKARVFRRVTILTLVAAALVAATLLWGVPALKYARATSMLENGEYDEARAAFTALNGYADTAKKLLQCDYLQAGSLEDSDTAEDLRVAADLYKNLGTYEESAERYQKTLYRLGETLLAAENFDGAAEAFQTLGDYGDSAQQLQETEYRQAVKLTESGNYVAARIFFEDLGDYRDAAQQLPVCDYYIGKNALEQENYETAVARLTAAGDTQDAAELLKQASYQLAQQRQEEGEYEAAGNRTCRRAIMRTPP